MNTLGYIPAAEGFVMKLWDNTRLQQTTPKQSINIQDLSLLKQCTEET